MTALNFKIAILLLLLLPTVISGSVIINDNSQEVGGVVIGGLTTPSVGGIGNTTFNETAGNGLYWRLDGTNDPPYSDWYMENMDFLFNVTYNTSSGGGRIIARDLSNPSSQQRGEIFYKSNFGGESQVDGWYIDSKSSIYLISPITTAIQGGYLSFITNITTNLSISLTDNQKIGIGTGNFGTNDIDIYYDPLEVALKIDKTPLANVNHVNISFNILSKNITSSGIITASNICYSNGSNCVSNLYYSDEIFINKNSSNAFLFNATKMNNTIDQKLAGITYLPTSFYTKYGTESGNNNLGNLSYDDGQIFNITEDNGVNAMDFYINFTGVSAFNVIEFDGRYAGGASHKIDVYVWHYIDSAWQYSFTIDNTAGEQGKVIGIAGENHVSGGLVQLRFFHPANGINTHKLLIDRINLMSGVSGGQTDTSSFFKTDGSRNATGNFQLVGFNLTTTGTINAGISANTGSITGSNFISTVATGTKPYACTSTTLNTNLNADLVDGINVTTSGRGIPDMSIVNTWSGVQTFTPKIIVNLTTITNVIQLTSITLPSCSGVNSGSIGRNATKLYYCDGAVWNALY